MNDPRPIPWTNHRRVRESLSAACAFLLPTARYRRGRKRSLRMESLESRDLFSVGGFQPAVSSDWFADYTDGSTTRHVNSATLSADGTDSSDPLVSIDGAVDDVYDWIIQFDVSSLAADNSVADTAELLQGGLADFQVLRGLGLTGQVLARSSGASLEGVETWLGANTLVSSYELDIVRKLQATPNDPNLSSTWGLENTGQTGGTADADIDAAAAWDLSTGSSQIVVAVIDTGVDYTHVDLAANIWTNPGEIAGNGIDDDGNGFVDDVHGWDFANDDADPMDDNNHGTHVSGTIAAVGNDGRGITGVNWSSSIMALKFLSAGGSGYTSDATQAVNYATMMRSTYGVDVRVTSNSWGGGGYSSAMASAIQASNNAGILFVAAAGNSGTNNDGSPHYPSNYDLANVISVAATDHNDNLAYFSNYGVSSVDLAAPGVSIYSTLPGNTYGSYSGTSMATPHVAGVAALAWSVDPTASVADIRAALLQGVDSLASLTGKVATGGRLNAFNTLQLLDGAAPRIPSLGSLVVSPGQAVPGDLITLTVSAVADSDGTVASVQFYRDSNANGQLDQADQVLGTDTSIVGAQASVTVDTTGYGFGTHTFFARALDNDSQWSLPSTAALHFTAPDDHGDQASSATAAMVGDTLGGTIGTGGDVDWFSFSAFAGAAYDFQTELLELSDSVLYLYGQDGQTLLAVNDDISWPANPASHISWTAGASGTYYLAVTAYSGSQTGTYNLNLTGPDGAFPPATDLGSVDFRELTGLDLNAGDRWYTFQAARSGFLTAETFAGAAGGNLQVTLYNQSHDEIAVSTTTATGERIDWDAVAGNTYFVRVSGQGADFGLRLANLVEQNQTSVIVHDTLGDDLFEFVAGDQYRLTINGAEYLFDSAEVSDVTFEGVDGNDRAVLVGSSASDDVSLHPAWGILTGAGYRVAVYQTENIVARSGGGADVARLYDSAGADVVVVTPDHAVLSGVGANAGQFEIREEGFAQVTVRAGAGGTDSARLYDSAGDDRFVATPTYAGINGDTFAATVHGFRNITAYSTAGGADRAYLYDSAGDDRFYAAEDYGRMIGDTFHNLVRGFRHVTAFSSAGGADRAYLYDSTGDDRFYATADYGRLIGDTFHNLARGFRQVTAYATAGGSDRAYLYDSAGDDRFFATADYGRMLGNTFHNLARGFGQVTGYANAGGTDRAYLYDSAGDDRFVATSTHAQMLGDTFHNFARGFHQVTAYAIAGGTDQAYFRDSAGDDHFYAAAGYGRMIGDTFHNLARGFRNVTAYSSAGGSDRAYLFDSVGDDLYVGTSTYGRMVGDSFDNLALDFRYVFAFATAGGNDQARLYDSAGADHLLAASNYARLSGAGFYQRTQAFDHVHATSAAGGSDTKNAGAVDYLLTTDGPWTDV